MKQLDLGSGPEPRQHDGYEVTGLDITDYGKPNVKVADLALQPLPFKDDAFELVTAYDILEHIPKMLYFTYFTEPGKVWEEGRNLTTKISAVRRNCMIELFNEVYRVLKDGGEFFFAVPKAGTPQYWGDPTHITEWCEDSVNYYSGDYFGHHDNYGHTSKFKRLEIRVDANLNWRMEVRLQAIKPCEGPYEV